MAGKANRPQDLRRDPDAPELLTTFPLPPVLRKSAQSAGEFLAKICGKLESGNYFAQRRKEEKATSESYLATMETTNPDIQAYEEMEFNNLANSTKIYSTLWDQSLPTLTLIQ